MASKILITPNAGSTTVDPTIAFQGAGVTTDITLRVPSTGGLSFEGTTGQLFSITDSMSGTIFSANDVSGIPSIEVLDTGLVKLAQYSGNVVLGSATDNGSKLQVNGTIRNSSIWINDGTAFNSYNENIRLFDSTNGISTISFGATGTSGIPRLSLVGYSDHMSHRFNGVEYIGMYDGYTTFAGSARAPIFYDSADTAYFLDPYTVSSGSSLFRFGGPGLISLYGYTDSGGSGVTNSNPFNSGALVYMTGTTTHFYSGSSVGLSVTNSFATGGTSLRAPLFYDSDNTGYYVDPASTSNVGVLLSYGVSALRSSTYGYSSAYQTVILGATSGNVTPCLNVDPLGNASGSFNGNGSEVMFRNGVNFITPNATNTAYHVNLITLTDGIVYTGDTRATILYDRDNTGYYINPSSTSSLYRVDINNNIVFTSYGRGMIGTYDSTRYQAVFSMGAPYVLPDDGTTTGNLYGLAWSHPNAGGIAGNLNTHGLLALENGIWLASVSGSIRCRDDMRSPIFYDANNTGYYTDPASTSNLLGLTVTNTITGSVSGSSTSCTGNAATTSMLQGAGTITYGASGTQWCNINGPGGTGTNGATPTQPSNDWYHHLIMNHANGGGYYIDFACCFHSDTFAIKRITSGVDTGWRTLLHTGNYNSYSPTLTGGGASGSWGISVTGSSTSCTGNAASASAVTMSAARTDPTAYPVVWGTTGATSQLYSCTAVNIQSSTGTLNATAVTTTGLITAGQAGFSSATYTAGRNRIWSFANADSYGISYFQGAGGYGGTDSIGVHFGSAVASSTFIFRTNGDFIATANVTAYSDSRIKTNITRIDNALEKVSQLNGYTFDRTDIETPRQTGVIAQEVLKVLPEAVTGSEDITYSVAYGNMVGLLIEAIKEQQTIIDSQEARIARLEALINTLVD